MGHVRLGQLPRTRRWQDVIDILAAPGPSAGALANAIADASEVQFDALRSDRGFSYLCWALASIVSAAKAADFRAALQQQGFAVADESNGIRFLAAVSQEVEAGLRSRGPTNGLTEVALRSFRETLTRLVLTRAESLFGIGRDEVQTALRQLSTSAGFGRLSRQFFSNVLAGTLQFVASKETSNHVGWGRTFADSEAAATFESELGAFAFQSAKIVETFAGEWYSKHRWLGDLDEKQTHRFVAHALTKLRQELRLAGAQP